MTVKEWHHENVNSKGIVKSGGGVSLKKGISSSAQNGCTIKSCKCIKGHWVSINMGYNTKNKSVSGFTLYFKNAKEYHEFLNNSAV
jgi:hypothetical protein